MPQVPASFARRRAARTPGGSIPADKLGVALGSLDAPTRALLDLSIRRRIRDDAMAPLLRTDPFHLAWRRARALERLAAEIAGPDDPLPLGDVRAALTGLPPEAWVVPRAPEAARARDAAAVPHGVPRRKAAPVASEAPQRSSATPGPRPRPRAERVAGGSVPSRNDRSAAERAEAERRSTGARNRTGSALVASAKPARPAAAAPLAVLDGNRLELHVPEPVLRGIERSRRLASFLRSDAGAPTRQNAKVAGIAAIAGLLAGRRRR